MLQIVKMHLLMAILTRRERMVSAADRQRAKKQQRLEINLFRFDSTIDGDDVSEVENSAGKDYEDNSKYNCTLEVLMFHQYLTFYRNM